MPQFLDVNVWLPLVWDGHVASKTAHQWAVETKEDLVLCRVTQLALLRHLTNPAIMGNDVLSNSEGALVLQALRSQKEILFGNDPAGLDNLFPKIGESNTPDRNRWTDAYLVAFAIAGGYELVTFDRGFARYESIGLRWRLLQMPA